MSRTTSWPRERRLLKIGRYELRTTREGPEWFQETSLVFCVHPRRRHLRLIRTDDKTR